MEIEGPHSPIQSARDFAIHIATVTIGILIALSLEALLEAHRNEALVEHARQDFRSEFIGNRLALTNDLKSEARIQANLESLIEFAQNRLAGRRALPPPVSPPRSFTQVQSTAWETATATQAVIHMPFRLAETLSAARTQQLAFNLLQDRAQAEWFELAAFGDLRTLPNEALKPALQKVLIAYAYVISGQAAERRLLATYEAALAQLGRE